MRASRAMQKLPREAFIKENRYQVPIPPFGSAVDQDQNQHQGDLLSEGIVGVSWKHLDL
jgi:hypothetical protein